MKLPNKIAKFMTSGLFYFSFAPAKLQTNLSFSEIPTPALVLIASMRKVLDNNAVRLLRLSYPGGDYDFRRQDIGAYEWKCAYKVITYDDEPTPLQ